MGREKQLTPPTRVRLYIGAALAGLTLLAYSDTFSFPFVDFDDQYYVTYNRHVHAGLTADGIRWAFTTFEAANWHPLTWLSLELDSDLYGGPKPGGFHLTNVLLHIANTLLLFWVLDGMTGRVWRSAVVAGLFAVHPLHVESVAWVAERKDVLSTLFWMLTLAAYLGYVRRPGVGRYLLVLLALALGLLAKPMLVTLPCVLLLLDYWPLGRWRPAGTSLGDPGKKGARPVPAAAVSPPALPPVPGRRLLLEKLPLFVLVAAACASTVVAQRSARAVESLEHFPLGVRVGNALLAYVGYLGKMLWPTCLAAFYPHPGATLSVGLAVGAGLLLLLITVLVIGPGRRRPYLAVGWLWYLGTLVPVIGLVQVGNQALADRYTYIPLIGIFLLLAWGAADLAAAGRLPRAGLVAATAGVLCACFALTRTQVGYWASNRALWEHALAVTDNNVMAHCGLGSYYSEQKNDLAAAQKEFEKAVAIDPKNLSAAVNLAGVYWNTGRLEDGLREYQRAIALDPVYATARMGYADALRALGRWEEAQQEYQRVLERRPDSAPAHHRLGTALLHQGLPEEAVAEFRKATELEPTDAQYHAALGGTLLEQGRYDEAEASLLRALDLVPPNHPAREAVARQLKYCQYMRALEEKLPAVLEAKVWLGGPREQLEVARLCQQPRWRRYAAAVRFYAAAFAAGPKLAEDRGQPFRYQAALAAVLAGTGRGEDAKQLPDKERAALREQGLQWLRAELAAMALDLQGGKLEDRGAAQQVLRRLQQTEDLAGVREPAALSELPEAERAAWQELWREVQTQLAQPVR
jgi:tetratricopeptide (TPR) repeat protein